MKILGGMVEEDSGEILLDGKPLSIRRPMDSRRLGIAVAYQDLSLVARMTVEDNVLLGREPRGPIGFVDRKEKRRITEELLDLLQADTRPEALVKDLDSSTLGLVEIAKALAWKPRMLLLDEVTASLHKDQVERVFGLLKRLKGEGIAILFVSHRFEEVFQLCDAATILRSGETVTSVKIAQVDEDELVFHMTGKRPEKAELVKEPAAISERMQPLLSVSDLSVPPRVRSVTMEAYPGEIVGIGGLQGQGQAEFIRAVYGAAPFQEGTVELEGAQVRFRSPSEALRHGLGFIPGDREREGILSVRSVTDNLYIAQLALRSIVRTVRPRRLVAGAREMIRALKIVVGSPLHPANSLSGGNQQKLVVGRWLMARPKLLLLDDPTKGVDITSRREIHGLLRQMARDGTTVIISSSENEELLAVSDRIYVFYEGRIVEELSGEERTEERLVTAMLGVGVS